MVTKEEIKKIKINIKEIKQAIRTNQIVLSEIGAKIKELEKTLNLDFRPRLTELEANKYYI